MLFNILKQLVSYITPIRIEQFNGAVTPQLEVSLVNGRYILNAEKVNYSYGTLHAILKNTFNKYKITERSNVSKVLILGFGAGSAASLLTKKNQKNSTITGVEKDPVVIALTQKYFNPDRFKYLELHNQDASDYVLHCTSHYDIILVDIFINDQVPDKFRKKPYLKNLEKLLSYHGILFFNTIVNNSKQEMEYAELQEGMTEIFGYCTNYKQRKNEIDYKILIHDRRDCLIDYSIALNQCQNVS